MMLKTSPSDFDEHTDEISFGALMEALPSPSDPDFTAIVSQSREFTDVRTQQTQPGELFPHQKLIQRFMSRATDNKEIFIFWDTGSGKTRAVLEVLKDYVEYAQKFGNFENNQRPIIIMEKSNKKVWEAELAKYGFYDLEEVTKNASMDASKQRNITNAISKTIDLLTQDALANRLSKLTNDQIRKQYGRALIVFDEIHTLRTKKIPGLDDEGIVTNKYRKIKKTDTKGSIIKKEQADFKKVYVELRRLMQLTNSIKIGLSASLMPDDPTELVSVTSLLLPEDKQLDINDLAEAINEGKQALTEYLEPKLRGRISYMAAADTTAIYIHEGESFSKLVDDKIIKTSLKVTNVRMSKRQYRVYKKTLKTDKNDKKNKNTQAFWLRSRKALQFVYYTNDDVKLDKHKDFEYFKNNKNQLVGHVFVKPPFKKTAEEKEEEAKRKFAYKNATTVEEKKRYQKAPLGPRTFEFAYEEYLFRGTKNIKNLAFATKENPHPITSDKNANLRLESVRKMSAKYAWIIEHVHEDLKYPGEGEFTFFYFSFVRDGGGILLGMCFEAMGYERFMGVNESSAANPAGIFDKPRYALLWGDTPKAVAKRILKVANHPSNKFGRKINILISSKVSETGLSLFNARKFIHGGPEYVLYRQSMGRTIRLDSHQQFEPEKKYVRTFLMAAQTPKGKPTKDHDIWFAIENKEKAIKNVEEVLKSIAFDCAINSGDNKKKTDETYDCVGVNIHVDGRKKSSIKERIATYHLHWATEEFGAIEFQIRSLFKIKSKFSLGEIMNSVSRKHKASTVVWTLGNMLSRKDLIQDRFGRLKYLNENYGIYVLSDWYKPYDDGNKLFLNEFLSSEEIMQKEAADSAPNLVDTLTIESFRAQWDNFTVPQKQELLEQCLLKQVKDKSIEKFVLQKLEPSWFKRRRCIFHYFGAINGASEKNSKEFKVKKGSPLRIQCDDDTNFRNATENETIKLSQIINEDWQRKQDERQKSAGNGMMFVYIHNVTTDGKFRLNVFQPGLKDRRYGKGIDIITSGRDKILKYPRVISELGIELELSPTTKGGLAELVEKVKDLGEEVYMTK